MAEETKKSTDEKLQPLEERINRRIDEEIAARTFRGIKEHYRELLFCIETKDIKRWNMWRKRQNKNYVELEGAQLSTVDLQNADLNGVRIQESDLSGAVLSGAKFEDAYLLNSYLFKVNFQNASLCGAKLSGADCHCVDFRNADLSHAKTDGANLTEIKIDKNTQFEETIFGDAILSISNKCETIEKELDEESKAEKTIVYQSKKRTKDIMTKLTEKDQIEILSKGIVNSVQFVDPVFGRKVRDEAWLNHFKKRCKDSKWKEIGLWLWKKTCNYGRSFCKWGISSLIIASAFGAVFADYGAPDFLPGFIKQFLYSINPEFEISSAIRVPTGFTPYYFSIVTFTTLGFGDVTPLNLAGEIWLALEVILGYIMLGGLISILANKLARRND